MKTSKVLREEAGDFKELAEQLNCEEIRQTALKIAKRLEQLAEKFDLRERPIKLEPPHRHH